MGASLEADCKTAIYSNTMWINVNCNNLLNPLLICYITHKNCISFALCVGQFSIMPPKGMKN